MNTQKNIAAEKFYRVLRQAANSISYFIFSLILLLILLLSSILNKELNRVVFTRNFITIYYITISLIFITVRIIFYLFKRKYTFINIDTVTAENLGYKAFQLFKMPFYSLVIFVILLFSYFIFASTSAAAIKGFYKEKLELINLYSTQVEEFNSKGVQVDYANLSDSTIVSRTDLTADQRAKLKNILETQKKIAGIDKLIKGMEKTLNNSMDNYNLIEKQLKKVKQQIADKEKEIADKEKEIEDQNNNLDLKINELEEIIRKLNENPGMFKKDRDDLLQKKEALDKEIIRIKEHIKNLEREKLSLEQEKSRLEQDRTNLEATLQNINSSTPVPFGQTSRNTATTLPSTTHTPVMSTPSPLVIKSSQFYDKTFIDKLFNIQILKIEMSSVEKILIAKENYTEVRNIITSVKSINEIFVYGSTDIKLMDKTGAIEIQDAKNRILFTKTKRITTDYNVTGSNFNFSFVLELTAEEQKKLNDTSSLVISIKDDNLQFPITMKSAKVTIRDGKIRLNIKQYLNL